MHLLRGTCIDWVGGRQEGVTTAAHEANQQLIRGQREGHLHSVVVRAVNTNRLKS